MLPSVWERFRVEEENDEKETGKGTVSFADCFDSPSC
jgi:hypothetical protein